MKQSQKKILFWGWIVAVTAISAYVAFAYSQMVEGGRPLSLYSIFKSFLIVFVAVNIFIPYFLVYCWPWEWPKWRKDTDRL